MAWDRDIIEEDSIVCIDWRVVTGLSDNIGARAEVNTLFFDKSIETLQKSCQQIVRQVWSTVDEEMNLCKS